MKLVSSKPIDNIMRQRRSSRCLVCYSSRVVVVVVLLNVFLGFHSVHAFASTRSKLSTRLFVSSKGEKPDVIKKAAGKQKRGSQQRTHQSSSSTPNSKKLSAAPSGKSQQQVQEPLTDYEANRNHFVNRQRLQDAINCEHFGVCSGCIVNQQVGTVDVIQSAKRYFSSTYIRRRRMDVMEQGSLPDTVEDSQTDGFFKVIIPSAVTGWRTQAKLAVAPKSTDWAKDGCHFGLFERGTHKVLSIPNCQVHHPSINRAIHALEQATQRVGITAAAHNAASTQSQAARGLRYVQLQVERSTGKLCLTLIWHAETLKETQPSLSRLVKELNRLEPDLWHSVWCHCNDSPGNNIFSRNLRRWHRIAGPEFIREPIPTIGEQLQQPGWLYFSPLTFRQGNLDGFDIIACDVARAIPSGSKVCELYAGVGLLGLTALVHHSHGGDERRGGGKPLEWIRCSDENPANPRCFHRAVESLPIEISGLGSGDSRKRSRYNNDDEGGMTLAELAAMMEAGKPLSQSSSSSTEAKASYMVASAAAALKAGQALGANVLIVDPPRKGLDEEVLTELCKPSNTNQPYAERSTFLTMRDEQINWVNDITTLIYVSCGFDALARDCERLLSSQGGWVLEKANGYVLFPGSDHVETLAIFQRK